MVVMKWERDLRFPHQKKRQWRRKLVKTLFRESTKLGDQKQICLKGFESPEDCIFWMGNGAYFSPTTARCMFIVGDAYNLWDRHPIWKQLKIALPIYHTDPFLVRPTLCLSSSNDVSNWPGWCNSRGSFWHWWRLCPGKKQCVHLQDTFLYALINSGHNS